MSDSKLRIHICDKCAKTFSRDPVKVDTDIFEGHAFIEYKKECFEVEDAIYCSLECFFEDIRETLDK